MKINGKRRFFCETRTAEAVAKRTKGVTFDRKFIYLGGLGRPWNGLAPGLEPGRQKKTFYGESGVHYGGPFGHFGVFSRVYF